MKRLLMTIILSALAIGGAAASARAQAKQSDEQILRDLISRADQDPSAIKRTDDAIFVSGAYPRPIVGREQMEAMKPKRDSMMKSRLNQVQKTELVRLVISDSKDMAYDFGNFTIDFDAPDKKHVSFNGSYLRVWRKIKAEWKAEAFFARPNEDEKTATNDSAALEQSVRQYVGDITKAEMSGDIAAVNRLLADDYLETDQNGNVDDKTSAVKFAQNAPKDIKYDFSIDELKVRQVGDTVVANYLYTFRRERNGKTLPTTRRRFTDVYVMRDGQLAAISSQSALLPPVRVAVKVDSKILDGYAGEYLSPNGFAYKITRDGDRLMIASATTTLELFPLSETEFFNKETPAILTFVKDASGNITHYVGHPNNGQADLTVKKIK